MTFSDIKWDAIFDVDLAIQSFPYLLGGLPNTLWIAFVSMFFGLLLGLLLALGKLSPTRLLRYPSTFYISFMRGVPILIILFILYSGFPFIGIEFAALTAAILGFSLNSAAYIAEIIRSSIRAVDDGQVEAARSLGMGKWLTLKGVVLPQATRIALPPLSNVFLDLIKASSLAAMITVPEIFNKAKIVGGREFDYMTVYIVVALIYWAICTFMSFFQEWLERHFERYLDTPKR